MRKKSHKKSSHRHHKHKKHRQTVKPHKNRKKHNHKRRYNLNGGVCLGCDNSSANIFSTAAPWI
jgi:hypothetical protein